MYQVTSIVPCLLPDYTPDPATLYFRPDVFYARPGPWVPPQSDRRGKNTKKDYHILCLCGIITNVIVCKNIRRTILPGKLGGSER